jgi:hypothetical protein
MPTPTYDLVASATLGTAASSVTISSIPGTYRDLVLVADVLGVTSEVSVALEFNGDTGSNYTYLRMLGNGSTAAAGNGTNPYTSTGADVASTTVRGNAIFHIMDYSVTDKHKTTLIRTNYPSSLVVAGASRWANTSAITSIKILTTVAGNYAVGSSFHLYGIVS